MRAAPPTGVRAPAHPMSRYTRPSASSGANIRSAPAMPAANSRPARSVCTQRNSTGEGRLHLHERVARQHRDGAHAHGQRIACVNAIIAIVAG